MNLIALGINHNSAAVEVRERVAFAPEQVSEALVDACDSLAMEEVVVLSTCNRTEIYSVGQKNSPSQVRHWLQAKGGLTDAEMDKHCYVHERQHAVNHLFRVAGGLDSLVLGESQAAGGVASDCWHRLADPSMARDRRAKGSRRR